MVVVDVQFANERRASTEGRRHDRNAGDHVGSAAQLQGAIRHRSQPDDPRGRWPAGGAAGGGAGTATLASRSTAAKPGRLTTRVLNRDGAAGQTESVGREGTFPIFLPHIPGFKGSVKAGFLTL